MDFTDYNFDYYEGIGGGGGGSSPSSPPSPASSSAQNSDVLTNYKCVLLNYAPNTTVTTVFEYYTSWLLNFNPLYPPSEFTPLHHVGFQVSELVFLVYLGLVGGCGRGAYHQSVGAIVLLAAYCLMQLGWGVLVFKSFDFLVWKSANLFVLLVHFCRACCCVRDSSRAKSRGSKSSLLSGNGGNSSVAAKGSEVEVVYSRMFAPLRVSYKQFTKIVACKRGFRGLACGENYAVEKRTRVDSLGLLVSGRLVVSQGGKPLHVILPFQFVDSPEYFGVATDELFQVTITALEDSKLLVWHRDKLRLTIMDDEFLRVMFDHIIGRDVVRKLIQVSDTIMTTSTTSSVPPSAYNTTPQPVISSITSISSSISASSSIPHPPSSPSHHSNNLTMQPPLQLTTNPSSVPCLSTNPILMVRKEKYAYQPTYLTSLSEETQHGALTNGGGSVERVNGVVQNGFHEEDDEEEDEDEEDEYDDENNRVEEVQVSNNEKDPMLA